MTGNHAIDLSRLEPPDAIETINYENLLAAILAEFKQRYPTFDATILESEPVTKVIEVMAYREILLRARVNNGVLACHLASARGSDLDNLAANLSIARQVITPGDEDASEPVAAVMEGDASLRRRVQLAPEGFSVAGSQGAYLFHALSAGARAIAVEVTSPKPNEVLVRYSYNSDSMVGKIKHAYVSSPSAGMVIATILGRAGNGGVDQSTLDAIKTHLSSDTVRPLTDQIEVQSATINEYNVVAKLTIAPGPDAMIVLENVQKQLENYTKSRHQLGRNVPRSGLIGRAHIEGVDNVELTSPGKDIIVDPTGAPYCTGITLNQAQ